MPLALWRAMTITTLHSPELQEAAGASQYARVKITQGNWTTARKVVNKMHHRLGLSLTLDSFQVPAHRHRSAAALRFSYPVSDRGHYANEKIAESESGRLKGPDVNSKRGERTSGFSGSASSAGSRLASVQFQLSMNPGLRKRFVLPLASHYFVWHYMALTVPQSNILNEVLGDSAGFNYTTKAEKDTVLFRQSLDKITLEYTNDSVAASIDTLLCLHPLVDSQDSAFQVEDSSTNANVQRGASVGWHHWHIQGKDQQHENKGIADTMTLIMLYRSQHALSAVDDCTFIFPHTYGDGFVRTPQALPMPSSAGIFNWLLYMKI
ncbi:hypothetical protein BJ912DRAFT_932092 [Pholiota molesta]|nr:hypothetical protein BJ912DRAFT_932092 [Pholiota molesta]